MRTDTDIDTAQVARVPQQPSKALVVADEQQRALLLVLLSKADCGRLQGCVRRLPASYSSPHERCCNTLRGLLAFGRGSQLQYREQSANSATTAPCCRNRHELHPARLQGVSEPRAAH